MGDNDAGRPSPTEAAPRAGESESTHAENELREAALDAAVERIRQRHRARLEEIRRHRVRKIRKVGEQKPERFPRHRKHRNAVVRRGRDPDRTDRQYHGNQHEPEEQET